MMSRRVDGVSLRLRMAKARLAHRRLTRLVALYGDTHSLIAQVAEAERAVLRDCIDRPALSCPAGTLRFHDTAQVRSRLESSVFNGPAITVTDDEPTGFVDRIE
jgi:predicted ATPase